jgi:HTH-type transcriptional regulator, transcriptional repressor of NAD biosynthesis genes
MRTGLIIGKFMPVTKGHIALIDFGLKNCDSLIVAVCTLKSEPIDGGLRYNWVKKYYGNNKRVRVVHITEEIPGTSESSREISKLWSAYLKEMFPEVNIVFASEQYGEYVAEYMGIDYKLFDVNREAVPISATKVRGNPFKNWDYIPDIVKPYYVKKVCVYGPDSCGKSTLATELARYYKTAYVPEIARNIFEWSGLLIDNLNISQLEQFARLQSEAVKCMMHLANKVLICDTDNITTQIYSEVYCGQITDEIRRYEDIDYDLYLFMDIDTPYIEEGQRNLPHRRREMFERFKSELEKRNINYVLINGYWDERFEKAVQAIDKTIFSFHN